MISSGGAIDIVMLAQSGILRTGLLLTVERNMTDSLNIEQGLSLLYGLNKTNTHIYIYIYICHLQTSTTVEVIFI